MIVNGDARLRANTNDPKSWQLLQRDGVTPIDLTGVTDVELVLVNRADKARTGFKVSDNPQKLSITDEAQGIIKFSPAVTDFTSEAVYSLFVIITDGSGKRSVPEGKEYTFTIRPDFS